MAAERERKQSLADAAAENRALQLQLQVHLADNFHCNRACHYYLQLRSCSSELAAEAAAENRALQWQHQVMVRGSFLCNCTCQRYY